ncbi:anti-sigma factor antagonist [Pseudotabrizicola sediminis]|uniref:Anti-sigma factor antagonist n=1 Tax=Pseudotabrizicola sediminis TaxID=2486418 RepID=A0ABY2KPM5_9RHOB|nr:STAS domain-containing protein [Pseudotabrizicola sediminis]TGD44672.1 anti-sigma factor antagonist [Pseudotabrizicola sediminis]TGD67577.1 anti-sigma factor antagonist [Tabrizicola sp. WMC-M-20]
MKLDCEMTPDLLIVRVRQPRIDAAGAIDFKDRMRDLTAAARGRVVLDLSCVTFIDSSGLGAVVAVRKSLGPDRPLELAALTPSVDKVFRLTRMDSVFTIHPDVPGLAGNIRDVV